MNEQKKWVVVSSNPDSLLERKRRFFFRKKHRGRFRTFAHKFNNLPWNYFVRIVHDPQKTYLKMYSVLN